MLLRGLIKRTVGVCRVITSQNEHGSYMSLVSNICDRKCIVSHYVTGVIKLTLVMRSFYYFFWIYMNCFVNFVLIILCI